MKKYVLTGGPGIGKTTLIELLASRGYTIVPEASRLVVEDETARGGDARPWQNLEKFQQLVAHKQIELESDAEKRNIDICFLDRGLIDGYGYCVNANIPAPEIITVHGKERYSKIFLLEPLSNYEKDGVRYEDKEEGIKIHNAIISAYKKFGYSLISVPILPPEERLKFILDKIK